MGEEDKIMGRRGGTLVYSQYRIDIATTEDIRFDSDGRERFSGPVKSPAPGHTDHPPKQGYDRKVIVPDGAVKNDVVAHLDSEGVAYVVEDVAPTVSEKDAFEQWGAENGPDAVEAMKWDRAVSDLDAGLISQAEYERGQNSNQGEDFQKPQPDKNRR